MDLVRGASRRAVGAGFELSAKAAQTDHMVRELVFAVVKRGAHAVLESRSSFNALTLARHALGPDSGV